MAIVGSLLWLLIIVCLQVIKKKNILNSFETATSKNRLIWICRTVWRTEHRETAGAWWYLANIFFSWFWERYLKKKSSNNNRSLSQKHFQESGSGRKWFHFWFCVQSKLQMAFIQKHTSKIWLKRMSNKNKVFFFIKSKRAKNWQSNLSLSAVKYFCGFCHQCSKHVNENTHVLCMKIRASQKKSNICTVLPSTVDRSRFGMKKHLPQTI